MFGLPFQASGLILMLRDKKWEDEGAPCRSASVLGEACTAVLSYGTHMGSIGSSTKVQHQQARVCPVCETMSIGQRKTRRHPVDGRLEIQYLVLPLHSEYYICIRGPTPLYFRSPKGCSRANVSL